MVGLLFPVASFVKKPATVVDTFSLLHRLSSTNHNFTATPLDVADLTRKIIIGVALWGATGGAAIVSSVKIHVPNIGADPTGTSLSAIPNTLQQVGGGGANATEFWQVDLPSGTSGDIVVTASSLMDGIGIAVRAAYNSNSTEDDAKTASGNPGNALVNCPINGFILTHSWITPSGAGSYIWTNINETYDVAQDAAPTNHRMSGGTEEFATVQINRSITATHSTAPLIGGMATSFVSYGPL